MRRILYLGLLALLAYSLTGLAQVGPDERAVVRRFGEVVARPGPGLWIGFPYGIDRIDRVPVRVVRQLPVGYNAEESNDAPGLPTGQLLTGDQNLVNLKLVVEYAIDDRDGALESYVVNRDQVDAVLYRETEALAAEWVGSRTVDRVLGGRAALTQWIAARLSDRLKTQNLGIVLQRVSVEYLAAPEEVRDAFESVNQAQTNIRTRRNQAEQEAERYLNDANTLKYRLQNEAAAYRNETETQARTEATAFEARRLQAARLRANNPDFLIAIWREEIGLLLAELKTRSRIELLDDFLGPNGLELNQFVPTKKSPGR